MSWRVVVVTGRCKLEQKLGYLVCRGTETKKVFIQEISTLIIESTAVSITAALMCELTNNKVNVIFCDEKHCPQSQLVPFYARHDVSGILKKQLAWKEEVKRDVWTEIVRLKIYMQYAFLKEIGSDKADILKGYAEDIKDGDLSNREGHAAKIYFDELFGRSFKRGDKTFMNGALNYGYTVVMSAFSREIAGCGYDTRIGIEHKNEFNYFNLSCDLMEPFRILVDRAVFGGEDEGMTADYKHYLCNVLNREVSIGGKRYTATEAIGIYSKSVFAALESGDISLIKRYEL